MTSATIKASHGTSGGHRRAEGFGLVIFAVAVLAVAGFFNLIDGIAAVANSHVFVAGAHYVVGDLRTWGWVTLILGGLQVLAALGVLAGNQMARWFGVVVVGLSAIAMMFFIPAYPFWALMIVAVDVVALYALCAYGSRENLAS
jgi:hypothetical protein